jgi:hypothetical protein
LSSESEIKFFDNIEKFFVKIKKRNIIKKEKNCYMNKEVSSVGKKKHIILIFVICGSAVNRLDKERAKNGFMEVDGVGYRVQKVSWDVK